MKKIKIISLTLGAVILTQFLYACIQRDSYLITSAKKVQVQSSNQSGNIGADSQEIKLALIHLLL